jgi:hypothetical protein
VIYLAGNNKTIVVELHIMQNNIYKISQVTI